MGKHGLIGIILAGMLALGSLPRASADPLPGLESICRIENQDIVLGYDSHTAGLSVQDVDGDGDNDLIVLRAGPRKAQIVLYRNDGPTLDGGVDNFTRVDKPYAEFDLNGSQFLGVSFGQNGEVYLLDMDGRVSTHRVFEDTWDGQYLSDGDIIKEDITVKGYNSVASLSVVDVNKDGHNDMVVLNGEAVRGGMAQAILYMNLGNGRFECKEVPIERMVLNGNQIIGYDIVPSVDNEGKFDIYCLGREGMVSVRREVELSIHD